MAVLEIDFDTLDRSNVEAFAAAHYVNAICDHLAAGGYIEGTRNDIAVDLSIACYVLDLDPLDMAVTAWGLDVCYDDKIDLQWRVEQIEDYLESWDRRGLFDFMLHREDWEKVPSTKRWVELENI